MLEQVSLDLGGEVDVAAGQEFLGKPPQVGDEFAGKTIAAIELEPWTVEGRTEQLSSVQWQDRRYKFPGASGRL